MTRNEPQTDPRQDDLLASWPLVGRRGTILRLSTRTRHLVQGLGAILAAVLMVGAVPVSSFAQTAPSPQETPAEDREPCETYAPAIGLRCGYITVPGNSGLPPADLYYKLLLPKDKVDGKWVEREGSFPTLFSYQGYGTSPRHNLGLADSDKNGQGDFLDSGYAVMLMTLRGTGCSGGTFEPFQRQEALDAKYVIDEWIAHQPWSNGAVAMIGASYAAITQLPVAAAQPEHLVAIAPILPVGDFYRDVIYPGGIYNAGTTSFFSATQGSSSGSYGALESGLMPTEWSGNGSPLWTKCAEIQASRAESLQNSPYVYFRSHPYEDDFWRTRSVTYDVEDIEVPVLMMSAWQDDVLGGRAIESLAGIKHLHAILTNGGHLDTVGQGDAAKQVENFFDYYVKGEQNGFGQTPRIQVWWETGRDVPNMPGWETEIAQWPAPQEKTQRFFLSGDGTAPGRGLLEQDLASVTGGDDGYAYVGLTGQHDLGTSSVNSWAAPASPGTLLTYTTPPLTEDVTALGSASLDLWLSSTESDTDIQVTLSEIRDYGDRGGVQEVFVQQGWLRASHRAENEQSRETTPVHRHEEAAALSLPSGEATKMRVGIFPFAHVFRKGSRIRVTIDAPNRVNDFWAFETLLGPAMNTVYHDSDHPSSLVLPVIPGTPEDMPRDYPECGTVLAQPCRGTSL